MRVAYFDCFSGISGNMILGALLDAGLELEALKEGLAELGLSGYEIEARRVLKRYIAGTLVDVKIQEEGVERHLGDILDILEESSLPGEIKETCVKIFAKLAEAEARVHGLDVEDIHFHEVGGLDAIVDVVGSVVGLALLGIEEVVSSAVHLGTGFVECAHGRLPVPAPATLALVKGAPTYGRGSHHHHFGQRVRSCPLDGGGGDRLRGRAQESPHPQPAADFHRRGRQVKGTRL